MGQRKLRNVIGKFAHKRILVVGDCMMDEWIWGKVRRISPEAPVPVVEIDYRTFTPGGAANVVSNFCALGAQATIAGVVGDDEAGRRLRDDLAAKGVDTTGLVTDGSRPTTQKTRIIAHSQQVVRADLERKGPVAPDVIARLLGAVNGTLPSYDAVLISDYNKGVVIPEVVGHLLAATKASNTMITAGPKPDNLQFFRGCTAVALNEGEAAAASGIPITDGESLCGAGQKLLAELKTKAVLITRGEHGMSLFTKDGEIHHVPALASEVYDVSGAGDTVISVLTLALAAGATYFEATTLANYAAAVVVKKVGTATLTCEELENALKEE